MFSAARKVGRQGKVYLLIGVAEKDSVRLYRWSSLTKRPDGVRELWKVRPIAPGEVAIMGSVNDDKSLADRLHESSARIAADSRIDGPNLEAAVIDTVTRAFSGMSGDHVRVGGLFQVASAEGGGSY